MTGRYAASRIIKPVNLLPDAPQQVSLHTTRNIDIVTSLLPLGTVSVDNIEQSRIVPGLLDEVAGSSTHRFNGQFDRTPRGHDNNRSLNTRGAQSSQKIESFASRCRIPRIVHVQQQNIKGLLHRLPQDRARSRSRHSHMTAAL
jgi:hypothetical protein